MAVSSTIASIGAGLYSAKKEDDKADRANALAAQQTQRAQELDEEALQLQRDRYAAWEETYGSIEKNLGSYYANLDPDDYRVQALEQEKASYQDNVKSIRKQFGAQGASGSNVEELALAQAQLASSQNRARIDFGAEAHVAEQQQRFLSLGINREAGIANSIGSLASSGSSRLGRSAELNTQRALNANNERDEIAGGLLSTGVDVYDSYTSAKKKSTSAG